MIASFEMTAFGTTTRFPALVLSLVARQVSSVTLPSRAPAAIQWPTRNGCSIWMASPANRLPSVSCSANPRTTAPTADAVRNRSPIRKVPTSTKVP